MYILLHFDIFFLKLVQGVTGRKLPSFLFSSEEAVLHKPGRFQGSCSSLLKLPVETKKIITFMNLIPLSYAYAIWGTSFAANGFTAASVSNWWKRKQNQIYRIFELLSD